MPTMDYNILIHKYLTGEITSEEKKTLDEWLMINPQNRQEFEEIKLIWENADEEVEVTDEHFQEELQKLESAVQESIQKDNFIKQYKRSNRVRNLVFITLFIFSGLLAAWPYFKPSSVSTISFANNQNKEVILPDSSRVLLNNASSITFNSNGNVREAILSGEAMFEVKKEERPFLISAGDIRISVKGTSFIVKAYPNSPIEVIVISGLVEMSSHNKKQVLSKGEKSVVAFEPRSFNKSINEDPNFNSWYTRKLEFKNTELVKVLALLEMQYETTFGVSENNILNCRFTGKFDNAKLDDVLQTLSYSLDIRFTQTGNHYSVSGKGCVP